MAPTRRKTQKHLPKRVYFKHGKYYYVNHKYQWLPLGADLSTAMAKWVEIVQPEQTFSTMNQLFDRYMGEIAPKKAEASYKSNLQEIKALREAFGEQSPEKIDAVKIYQFLDRRGKVAPSRANKEKALLSHVFTKAIRWGVVRENPCREVESIPTSKRNRYITDTELNNVIKIAEETMKNIIEVAYVTGLRQKDLLNLKKTDILEEGLSIHISKTKNKILIRWTDRLKHLINNAVHAANIKNTDYLFSTLKGKKYSSSGFQSNWQKLIRHALGYHYDIIIMVTTDNPVTNKIALEEAIKKFPNTPILISYENLFFFWGKTAKLEWRLIDFNSDIQQIPIIKEIATQKSLDKKYTQNTVKLINGNYLPLNLYEQLEKISAHYHNNKLIDERFTFHDIRRKTATDLEAQTDRETARKLLGHSDQKMTERYISGIQKVWPLR